MCNKEPVKRQKNLMSIYGKIITLFIQNKRQRKHIPDKTEKFGYRMRIQCHNRYHKFYYVYVI